MSAKSPHDGGPSGLMCDDPSAVSAWLQAHGEPVTGDVTIARVGFGQSNITTVVSAAGGGQWVLREPPPGNHAQSAHDVTREAHIVSKLADSGVPVPRVIGTGTAPSRCGVLRDGAGARLGHGKRARRRRTDSGATARAGLASHPHPRPSAYARSRVGRSRRSRPTVAGVLSGAPDPTAVDHLGSGRVWAAITT